MSVDALTAWLETVQLTKPLTLDDMRELQKLCKGQLPGALVDIYEWRPDEVTVRITHEGRLWSRNIRVV